MSFPKPWPPLRPHVVVSGWGGMGDISSVMVSVSDVRRARCHGRVMLCDRFGESLRELGFSGLTVDQLHAVLSAWRILPRGANSWEEAVAAGNSGEPYPMGPFACLVQSLRRYSGPQSDSHQPPVPSHL